jgi:hypothetical protein
MLDTQADVVRLGKGVRGPVLVYNKEHEAWEAAGKVTLPEGWYAGPGPIKTK